MHCAHALAALDELDAGRPPAPEVLAALEASGLVTRTTVQAGAGGVAPLRADLKGLQARREAAKAGMRGASAADLPRLKAELSAMDAEERELRTAILALADLPAEATSHPQLTFAGRDLQGELRTRIARVGDRDLATFRTEFAAFRDLLTKAAARASSLLGRLSPVHQDVEEIHLRSAVISLGADTRAVEVVAKDFSAAMDHLRTTLTDDEGRVQLAEAFAASGQGTVAELGRFFEAHKARFANPGDAASGCAIAWGEGANRDRVLETGVGHARVWGAGEVAPGVLFEDAGRPDRAGLVPGLMAQVASEEPDAATARWAAALLALSPASPDLLVTRFREVRTWLARFGTDGLSAPAAMLVLLDADAPELLDDLRLASTAVREHQLSLSALENLGLGVKLLVQVALGRTVAGVSTGAPGWVPGPVTAGALGVPSTSVALPITRFPRSFTQAVSSYHAATIHRRVQHHDWHHPVHTHRVYG